MKCCIISQLSLFILTIISFAACDEKNYLKIPLTYFPHHKYNDSTPSMTMDNIIRQRLYANISIGTPKSELHLALLFDSNEFYIIEGKDNFTDVDDFEDLKYYKGKESATYNDSSEEQCDIEVHTDYFEYANCKQDIFDFNNKKAILSFYEGLLNRRFKIPGGIGLLLEQPSELPKEFCPRERSFFEKVKVKKLISTYDWSIFFDSKEYKKEEKGFLLMGCPLGEINSDLGYYKNGIFSEKYKNETNMKYTNLEFLLNKIFIYSGNSQSYIVENLTDVNIEFDFNNGGIKIPETYLKHFEKVFEEYISKNLCSKDNIYIFTGDEFFFCKKSIGDDIKKIKENFPVITFNSANLDYNFSLNADDLFIEEGDFIFCLVTFSSVNEWNIGKPLLKKYQFSFNYDQKKIYFYKDAIKEENKENSGIPVYVFILSIVGVILIMSLVIFLLFKFYFYDKCIRRKRANELIDDNFDYTSKENDQKNPEEQQNNEENDKLGLSVN